MSGSGNDCVRVGESLDSFLDGRLDPRSQTWVRAHLASCESCQGEARSLRRLSRLAARQPLISPPDDLADRVRARLHERRRGVLSRLGTTRSASSLARVAAAVLLLPGAAVLGYWLGQGHSSGAGEGMVPVAHRAAEPPTASSASYVASASDPSGSTPPHAGLQPVERDPDVTDPWAPYREEGFEPALFHRAGFSLVGELMLDGDERRHQLQAPALRSHLDYFDLGEQARRFLAADRRLPLQAGVPEGTRSLARLVNQLSDEADDTSRFVRSVEAQRDQLRQAHWLTALPQIAPENPAMAADPARLRRVVDDNGPGLPADQKHSLVRLLALKHDFVHGRHQELVMWVFDEAERAGGTAALQEIVDPYCEDALSFVIATALPEIGLERLALPYRQMVDGTVPEGLFHVLRLPMPRPARPRSDMIDVVRELQVLIQREQQGQTDQRRAELYRIQESGGGLRIQFDSRRVIEGKNFRLEILDSEADQAALEVDVPQFDVQQVELEQVEIDENGPEGDGRDEG